MWTPSVSDGLAALSDLFGRYIAGDNTPQLPTPEEEVSVFDLRSDDVNVSRRAFRHHYEDKNKCDIDNITITSSSAAAIIAAWCCGDSITISGGDQRHRKRRRKGQGWFCLVSYPYEVWVEEEHRSSILQYIKDNCNGSFHPVESTEPTLLLTKTAKTGADTLKHLFATLQINNVYITEYGQKCGVQEGLRKMERLRQADPDCKIMFDVATNISPSELHHFLPHNELPAGVDYLTLVIPLMDKLIQSYTHGLPKSSTYPLFQTAQLDWALGSIYDTTPAERIHAPVYGSCNVMPYDPQLKKFKVYNTFWHQISHMKGTLSFENIWDATFKVTKKRLQTLEESAKLLFNGDATPQLRIEGTYDLPPNYPLHQVPNFCIDHTLQVLRCLDFLHLPTKFVGHSIQRVISYASSKSVPIVARAFYGAGTEKVNTSARYKFAKLIFSCCGVSSYVANEVFLESFAQCNLWSPIEWLAVEVWKHFINTSEGEDKRAIFMETLERVYKCDMLLNDFSEPGQNNFLYPYPLSVDLVFATLTYREKGSKRAKHLTIPLRGGSCLADGYHHLRDLATGVFPNPFHCSFSPLEQNKWPLVNSNSESPAEDFPYEVITVTDLTNIDANPMLRNLVDTVRIFKYGDDKAAIKTSHNNKPFVWSYLSDGLHALLVKAWDKIEKEGWNNATQRQWMEKLILSKKPGRHPTSLLLAAPLPPAVDDEANNNVPSTDTNDNTLLDATTPTTAENNNEEASFDDAVISAEGQVTVEEEQQAIENDDEELDAEELSGVLNDDEVADHQSSQATLSSNSLRRSGQYTAITPEQSSATPITRSSSRRRTHNRDNQLTPISAPPKKKRTRLSKFLQRRVVKYFTDPDTQETGLYFGSVAAFEDVWEEDKEDYRMRYLVKYDDGDQEHLSNAQLNKLFDLYSEHEEDDEYRVDVNPRF